MKLFNARLDLIRIVAQSATTYVIDANIIDNSGTFIAADVRVDDIIYCYALTPTYEYTVSRYKVITVNSVNGVAVNLAIDWDEPTTDYSEPQAGMDAIIGRPLPGGVTSITTASNNVGGDILQLARNIDFEVASFSSDIVLRKELVFVIPKVTLGVQRVEYVLPYTGRITTIFANVPSDTVLANAVVVGLEVLIPGTGWVNADSISIHPGETSATKDVDNYPVDNYFFRVNIISAPPSVVTGLSVMASVKIE